MNKKTKQRAILVGYAKLFQAEIMCIIVVIFMKFLSKAPIMNYIFGFCTISILAMIMFDFALKIGRKAMQDIKLHNEKTASNFGLTLGFFITIPLYIMAILVVLAKFNIIGNFLPYYKILTSFFLPIIDIFAHNANAENASVLALIVIFILPLIIPIAVNFSYKVGYNDINLEEKIVYKNQNK